MKTILVTGGCGFIGSNFIKYILDNFDDYLIINIDSLTYAANNLVNLKSHKNYKFYNLDINKNDVLLLLKRYNIDIIVNFAAETHVDNSINNSKPFIHSNILGVHNLLLCALQHSSLNKFIQISTDEVYGSQDIDDNREHIETDVLSPSNPYSASKASAEMLCYSYYKTHNIPIIITRASNNYGENQHLEKFIPKIISSIHNSNPIHIYGDGKNIRNWLNVKDHCSALKLIIDKGEIGNIYNISSSEYLSNNQLVSLIHHYMTDKTLKINYVQDRKGHDKKYSINSSKLRNLGWTPKYNLIDSLPSLIKSFKFD
ncbi:GDP-mannose 4,6-dehydratase [Staphylococcus epidermidis]|jgi:dTDP-glucose 4,6-dehydratase|uniref:dTDP-glucose 4,6-dehydratase n=1 Tax=Staphylococcus epidermidis TaxID=1282 RepID=UPI000CD48880|nr:GDP-mannose 4,6-dehydratase [Staphylococcus epidermidis]MCG2159934.1 GDP-mannose 4,6-dehydratase [Staphylococcus epidermidis]MCG2261503.1 GDP-mannose 4,6-dehydratase [Staphylococcus epidermidis]MCG7830981.1 GDP-mannose 4,6-dehydratase [Staphylococcus epidermidis]MCG7837870.1 GDP-mannose 4,6-dehydratase [Staphylococcus epidermidis]MCG7847430.1 GDP-mannose 4,6-dehydratase [Staphylococcus epidermidis]